MKTLYAMYRLTGSMERARTASPEVLIIGGGATGAGIARDLAMRGAQVLLAEAGDFCTGASGGNHGMLHSGARYAVKDPQAAAECAVEGATLKRIARSCIEDCGGMYVSSHRRSRIWGLFLRSCQRRYLDRRTVRHRGQEGGAEPQSQRPARGQGGRRLHRSFFLVWSNVEAARQAGAGPQLPSFGASRSRTEGYQAPCSVKASTPSRSVQRWSSMPLERGAPYRGDGGLKLEMQLDKGSMIVLNGRAVNGLVNRLRPPSTGLRPPPLLDDPGNDLRRRKPRRSKGDPEESERL